MRSKRGETAYLPEMWTRPRTARMARGSAVDMPGPDWLNTAIRARFPKLAAVLGDRGWEVLLASYMAHAPHSQSLSVADTALPRFLTESTSYPGWCAELAAVDLAHAHVAQAPRVDVLSRRTLRYESALKL